MNLKSKKNLVFFFFFLILTSCIKGTGDSSSASSQVSSGEGTEKQYEASFKEVYLTSLNTAGHYVLLIELIPEDSDTTTDSFEFYICSKNDPGTCSPKKETPEFVESLYIGSGYEYPMAPEGEDLVYLRACKAPGGKTSCGPWQTKDYLQLPSEDLEVSQLLEYEYEAENALDDATNIAVSVVEEASGEDLSNENVDVVEVLVETLIDETDDTTDDDTDDTTDDDTDASNPNAPDASDTNTTDTSDTNATDEIAEEDTEDAEEGDTDLDSCLSDGDSSGGHCCGFYDNDDDGIASYYPGHANRARKCIITYYGPGEEVSSGYFFTNRSICYSALYYTWESAEGVWNYINNPTDIDDLLTETTYPELYNDSSGPKFQSEDPDPFFYFYKSNAIIPGEHCFTLSTEIVVDDNVTGGKCSEDDETQYVCLCQTLDCSEADVECADCLTVEDTEADFIDANTIGEFDPNGTLDDNIGGVIGGVVAGVVAVGLISAISVYVIKKVRMKKRVRPDLVSATGGNAKSIVATPQIKSPPSPGQTDLINIGDIGTPKIKSPPSKELTGLIEERVKIFNNIKKNGILKNKFEFVLGAVDEYKKFATDGDTTPFAWIDGVDSKIKNQQDFDKIKTFLIKNSYLNANGKLLSKVKNTELKLLALRKLKIDLSKLDKINEKAYKKQLAQDLKWEATSERIKKLS